MTELAADSRARLSRRGDGDGFVPGGLFGVSGDALRKLDHLCRVVQVPAPVTLADDLPVKEHDLPAHPHRLVPGDERPDGSAAEIAPVFAVFSHHSIS